MSGCRSCSGRLFHSVGPAVAKQRSSNWLRDLLTKHVRWSADRWERQPAAVTSVHSSARHRYTGAVPANKQLLAENSQLSTTPHFKKLTIGTCSVEIISLHCHYSKIVGGGRHLKSKFCNKSTSLWHGNCASQRCICIAMIKMQYEITNHVHQLNYLRCMDALNDQGLRQIKITFQDMC